jgi:hypothetical protein
VCKKSQTSHPTHKTDIEVHTQPACMIWENSVTILSGTQSTGLPPITLVSKLIQFIWNSSLLIPEYTQSLFYTLAAYLKKWAYIEKK